MVDEITPNYYAAQALVEGYVLRGNHFNGLPADVIGIYSTDNNDPLMYRNASVQSYIFDIVQRDNTIMEMQPRAQVSHPVANYLGCIVSSDRQIVYWVNTEKPLP